MPKEFMPGVDTSLMQTSVTMAEPAVPPTPSGSPEESDPQEEIIMPLPEGSAEWIGDHYVRASPGTSRPPGILPSIWCEASAKQKKEANQ